MSNEFSTLISELREHILYLRELGVENFSVDLPEISVSPKFKVQSPRSEVSREKLERFIPTDDLLRKTVDTVPKSSEVSANQTRLNLLESSKLSRLPSLTKRTPLFNGQPTERIREKEEMPKNTIEEIPSLFGDVLQKLPESTETIEDIRADIGNCTRCPLWEGRTKIVHSTGNHQADLMFVGEAPGADEDAQGEPFVGRSGQLLTKIIEGIGMKREDVFIGNINRCRPPDNRTPTLPEAHTCRPFLTREIAVVKPKIIVVMGNTAMKNLLDTKEGITKLRGEFQDYYGVKVMPTFHPAYLLRDPRKKREVWEDMKKVRDEINRMK